MTSTEVRITPAIEAFVDDARRAADTAFRVFRETGTVSANGTVNFVERVARRGTGGRAQRARTVGRGPQCEADPRAFDGEVLSGDGPAGFVTGYAKVFREHPEITSIVHVHTPWLGGWAQTHRTLRIKYAASQRLTLSGTSHRTSTAASRRAISYSTASSTTRTSSRSSRQTAASTSSAALDCSSSPSSWCCSRRVRSTRRSATGRGTVDFDATNLGRPWGRSGLLDEARRRGLV